MDSNKNNLSSDDISNSPGSANLTEKGALNSVSDGIELEKVNSKTTKKLPYSLKITESHKECLKKYLNENSLIEPTEARNRLHEETGLEVSVPSIDKALKKMKEEVNKSDIELPSYGLIPEIDSKHCNHGRKLKYSHIECLKKYLSENIYIGNTEARNRLHKETGLYVSIPLVRNALIKLEKEIDQEDTELPSYGSVSKFGSVHCNYGHKLKYQHIECLKKYLSEDSSIGNKKARNRLFKETGLDVSVTSVRKALINLKMEINKDDIKSPLPGLAAKVRSRAGNYGFKIKDSHMECLSKYLNENSLIGPTEARNRLREETGLEVHVPTVLSALVELREQINPEQAVTPSLASDSKVKIRQSSNRSKLKDSHIERLKEYLKEDDSIGGTEARNRLHEETGLEVSITTVHKALVKLSKEINQESNELFLPTSESKVRTRSRELSLKIKDSHIECLKKYLSENSLISIIEAKKKLQEETGLKVSYSTVRKALKNIKDKMDPEHLKLHSSTSGIKHKGYKLKDIHTECLKRCLIANNSITLSEAKEKLHKETGLEVQITSIWRALKKLRKEIELE